VRRGQEIEASCKGKEAIAAFEEDRSQWLALFLKAYQRHLGAQLASAVSEPVEKIAWLHENSSPYSINGDVLRDIFDAYRLLRFDHQYGYAVYKLESTPKEPFWRFLKWPPSVQRAALSGLSSSCFIGALILSALLVCADLFAFSDPVELYLRTAAIVVAIFGAALRTIQEGLGLEGETERYREYRERVSRLYDLFKHTSDEKQRLKLMEEVEIASVQEMQDFLRIHQRARFVLE